MTFNDLMNDPRWQLFMDLFPDATLGDDDDGQLIIYTDKRIANDEIIDFEED